MVVEVVMVVMVVMVVVLVIYIYIYIYIRVNEHYSEINEDLIIVESCIFLPPLCQAMDN